MFLVLELLMCLTCATLHPSLLVCFIKFILHFRQVSAQETDHYRLIAVVGIDLLEEVTKSHRCHEHLIHSVVLLQLSILNVLTRQQCLSCLARSAATPTEMILQNTLHFIKCWVSEFQYRQIEWKEFRWVCIAYIMCSCVYVIEYIYLFFFNYKVILFPSNLTPLPYGQ